MIRKNMDKIKKDSSKSYGFFYVRTVIFLSLFAVTFLHLLSSIPALFRSFNSYKQSREVQHLNNVSDNLFTAVGNYGFERGRVNIVLNNAGPVEKMESNIKFISARRVDGDKALNRALVKLAAQKTAETPPFIDAINKLIREVRVLREEADRNLVIPKEKRKQEFAEIWFAKMTEYIENIGALLVTISNGISNADGMISRYSSIKHETLNLRNTAGPEMSILSATILTGEPIKAPLAQKIISLQVNIRHYFQRLTDLCQPLTDPQIPMALEALKKVYFNDYLPYREVVFPLAIEGGPYPYSQPEFLTHGVKALQQIASFMNTTVAVTQNYADRKVAEAHRQIIVQLFCTIGSLLMTILIFLYVHFRVVNPIGKVTSSVLRLAQKELDVDVPFQDGQNEIGEMARAVEVFKGMAHQLEKDVVALESASAERERLIAQLQATLNELKVLRGILPICSICKNIRNDEGYYEQIEAYFHKHTGVDFSHTICNTCMKKYYPEEYKSMAPDYKNKG